ncbi:TetR family transcriptional regulator [Actinomadura sp. LD22]|uniref:TetR family transcriptional regulator n=1 Tax=Actinomadura physcomitrii TaxID=2650748 RepID=A0A6I4MS36_9ACTN|nr:TetR-like C-terminal domain-containing protein [Actinomadura physcomitrii]MWA06784.1 TetR family transcriptional regulator [Actinomadura physcomitrii]
MPRAGLTPDAVVDAAIAVVDAGGPGALTLAAVAGRAGVATPSLYKHVRNLAELRQLVTARILDELADRLGTAAMGRSKDDAVAAMMRAYRGYVVEHPSRYGSLEQSAEGAGSAGAAAERVLGVIYAVLRGYGLDGPDLVHATRCLRSAVHGFAVLEAAGGFGLPEDLEASYERLITLFTSGFSQPRV